MAEKDIILEEKTTEEKTTAETKEEIKEETPLEDVVLETKGGTKSLLGATSGTGDIAATSLDTKTTPAGTDNLILFNQNTNVGYQIDYDNLADAILNKITSKTYANQVGGSSAATLLAQLSTLNTNITPAVLGYTVNSDCIGEDSLYFRKVGRVVFVGGYFKTKGAEIQDGTVLFTLNEQPNLSQTFYLFIYGYDKTIKGKLEPTDGNKLKASGSFSAYSAYCYCDGWLWT